MEDTISIVNDEGETALFHVIEQTQINGNSYLLASECSDETEDEEDELEAWIFKQVRTEDDEIIYTIIENDNEIDAVVRVFEALLET